MLTLLGNRARMETHQPPKGVSALHVPGVSLCRISGNRLSPLLATTSASIVHSPHLPASKTLRLTAERAFGH